MEICLVTSNSQLYECFAIRSKVFVEEQGVPADLEIDEYDSSPAACGHILLKIDGVPVGTGRWITYKKDTAKIQRLAVLQQFRGKGVGKRLLQELEKLALIAGNHYCILDGQCHAESFYASQGYLTISEQPFVDAGIMHVRMQKSLIKSI